MCSRLFLRAVASRCAPWFVPAAGPAQHQLLYGWVAQFGQLCLTESLLPIDATSPDAWKRITRAATNHTTTN